MKLCRRAPQPGPRFYKRVKFTPEQVRQDPSLAWCKARIFHAGVAQINLLLNRAAPWLDIDSYLPYEGKVVIKNKKAKDVSAWIPLWVNREALQCRVGGRRVPRVWVGNYLLVDNLSPRDQITLTFPVPQQTVKLNLPSPHHQWIWSFDQ